MTDVIVSTGTAIIVADSTDHSPAAGSNLGTRTDQIDLTSLAAGAYRQCTKLDFGATRAKWWEATAAIEWSSAPTAGGVIRLFIGWSHSATAGTGNPGNLSGADGAYVGYGAAATDADECITQLDFVGSFAVSNDADIQIGHLGLLLPVHRYGTIVIQNDSDAALIADAVEMSVRLSPVQDEF